MKLISVLLVALCTGQMVSCGGNTSDRGNVQFSSTTQSTDSMRAPITFELLLDKQPNGLIRPSFQFSNQGDQEWSVAYFYPFMDADIHFFREGKELRVLIPESDLGVQSRVFKVPAGGTARLDTPIRYQFGKELTEDEFLYVIEGVSGPVTVEYSLRFEEMVISGKKEFSL